MKFVCKCRMITHSFGMNNPRDGDVVLPAVYFDKPVRMTPIHTMVIEPRKTITLSTALLRFKGEWKTLNDRIPTVYRNKKNWQGSSRWGKLLFASGPNMPDRSDQISIPGDYTGLFDIEGAFNLERWTPNGADPYGHFVLSFVPYAAKNHRFNFCFLFQGGNQYIVTEEKRIPKSRLVVSVEELERYAAAQGMELVDLPAETEPSNLTPGKGKSTSKFTLRLEKILRDHQASTGKLPTWHAVVNILRRPEHADMVNRIDDPQKTIILIDSEEISYSALRDRLTEVRKVIRGEKTFGVIPA